MKRKFELQMGDKSKINFIFFAIVVVVAAVCVGQNSIKFNWNAHSFPWNSWRWFMLLYYGICYHIYVATFVCGSSKLKCIAIAAYWRCSFKSDGWKIIFVFSIQLTSKIEILIAVHGIFFLMLMCILMVNNPYALTTRTKWKQNINEMVFLRFEYDCSRSRRTVSTKNLIMIIFMWDDAHGLMHTSLTATAIDDEKWNRQQQQYYAAANEDSHRLKKCRWNTFTLKLRLTTLRCSIFVFMNDFRCVRVVVVDDLFVVRKQTPLFHWIPSLCGRNCAALLNIPIRWFELLFSSVAHSIFRLLALYGG